MTTSSDHNSNPAAVVQPRAAHWEALTARLPAVAKRQLSDWMDEQLALLEQSQARFMTNRSRMKSLRR